MVEAGSLALTVPCLEEEEDVLHRTCANNTSQDGSARKRKTIRKFIRT